MTPYRLSDVLASIATALSEAQHISDQYTAELQKTYQNPTDALDALMVPNTQFEKVSISLKIAPAIMSQSRFGESPEAKPEAEPESETRAEPPEEAKSGDNDRLWWPSMWVYVNEADLRRMPEWTVSTFEITLRVEDTETLIEGGGQ